MAKRLRSWAAPGDQFQVDVDAGQTPQACYLHQALARRSRRVQWVDDEAVFRRQLIEQLLDVGALSAVAGKEQHSHGPDPLRHHFRHGRR